MPSPVETLLKEAVQHQVDCTGSSFHVADDPPKQMTGYACGNCNWVRQIQLNAIRESPRAHAMLVSNTRIRQETLQRVLVEGLDAVLPPEPGVV